MVDAVTSAFEQIKTAALTNSSGGSSSGLLIGVGIFVGLSVISVVIALIYFWFWDKKQWQIKIFAHYQNPLINGVSFGNSPILVKRVRFKDGRVVYLYKTPIQGYSISPELLTYSSPNVHNVIITSDKKLFTLIGISSIDVQRKQLGVDISYPDVEMDRQDLQQFVDNKHFEDPNERFKIIAKIAMWVFIIVGVIVITVLVGKYYIDGKNVDASRDATNLQTAKMMEKTMDNVNVFMSFLNKNNYPVPLDLNITDET